MRIGVDGDGVTTLVVFMLCPLQCRYCLNPQTLSMDNPFKTYTPAELYEELKIDDLYFQATGGGITFGGGEPLLRAEFIKEFRANCGSAWKINVETSLNVPLAKLKTVVGCIDNFIIDVKDMNPLIYSSYTGRDNAMVKTNLEYLAAQGLCDTCTIRVPLIPDFNTEAGIDSEISALQALGYKTFDKFEYTTTIHGKRKRNLQSTQGDPQTDCTGE
jgi:Pyruvate-formate lyase-activating enzyme